MTAAATSRTVGVGMLGYGLGGATFHAPLIKAVDALAVRTIVTSRTADVARDFPGATAASSPQAIFDDPAIELVVISTPNPTHADLAARALRAGKHVVIDKPMTATSVDADRLIALAEDSGRLLSVYHNRRWDGDYRTLKRCIAEGRLGHVVLYEAHYDRFRPAVKPGWREVRDPGSGLLWDLGPHVIDQALDLFGLPETVTADVLTQRPQAHVDDYFALTLGYGRLRAIVGASTLVARPGPHFAVHGDGGSFVKYGMDPQEAALKAGTPVRSPDWGRDDPADYGVLVAADGTRTPVPTEPGAYAEFYARMAAAILDGTPVPVDPRAARDVVRIIELARRSSLERRTVAFAG